MEKGMVSLFAYGNTGLANMSKYFSSLGIAGFFCFLSGIVTVSRNSV